MYTAYFNYLLVPYTPNTLYIHVTLVIPLCMRRTNKSCLSMLHKATILKTFKAYAVSPYFKNVFDPWMVG